jgi:hypothetical protein
MIKNMEYRNPVQIDASTGTRKRRGKNKADMPVEVVELWDKRIRMDLEARMTQYDDQWSHNSSLVRNSAGGFLKGNLVADFVGSLHSRLLQRDFAIEIKADDPDIVEAADNAEIVAGSVARIAGLKDAFSEALADATWASFGVVEFGHPLDPWSNDVMRSIRSPNVRAPDADVMDEWDEVDPSEIESGGMDLSEIEGFDPFAKAQVEEEVEVPDPIFNPSFGYPWAANVDPRLIVMPITTRNQRSMVYITRLRFMSKGELLKTQNVDIDSSYANARQHTTLFEQTESESDISLLGNDLFLIAETYIIRDRVNPNYNNWYMCHVLGHKEALIRSGPNPYGGMIPFSLVKLNKTKNMYDTSLAEEIRPFAEVYSTGVESISDSVLASLNRKTAIGDGAGIDDKELKKLESRRYKGVIKIRDVGQIKQIDENAKFDHDMVRGMLFIKSSAQARSGTSDLDQGQAVKDITASQVKALLDATGIQVLAMSDQINLASRESVIKLMHLVGMYSMANRGRKFYYGNRFASIDRGTHDFTSSMIYDVTVMDSNDEITNEERMTVIQMVRTLATNEQMSSQVNWRFLLTEVFKRFGVSKNGINPPAPPADPNAIAAMMPIRPLHYPARVV